MDATTPNIVGMLGVAAAVCKAKKTLCNNSQQHATGCANGGNNFGHPTMLGAVGQQCRIHLHRA